MLSWCTVHTTNRGCPAPLITVMRITLALFAAAVPFVCFPPPAPLPRPFFSLAVEPCTLHCGARAVTSAFRTESARVRYVRRFVLLCLFAAPPPRPLAWPPPLGFFFCQGRARPACGLRHLAPRRRPSSARAGLARAGGAGGGGGPAAASGEAGGGDVAGLGIWGGARAAAFCGDAERAAPLHKGSVSLRAAMTVKRRREGVHCHL